jgi:hypothetical protein
MADFIRNANVAQLLPKASKISDGNEKKRIFRPS